MPPKLKSVQNAAAKLAQTVTARVPRASAVKAKAAAVWKGAAPTGKGSKRTADQGKGADPTKKAATSTKSSQKRTVEEAKGRVSPFRRLVRRKTQATPDPEERVDEDGESLGDKDEEQVSDGNGSADEGIYDNTGFDAEKERVTFNGDRRRQRSDSEVYGDTGDISSAADFELDDNSIDNGLPQTGNSDAGKKTAQSGKRAQAILAEKPKWDKPNAAADDNQSVVSVSDDDEIDGLNALADADDVFNDANFGWVYEAHYTPAAAPGARINLLAQPPALAIVLRGGIRSMTRHTLSVTAYIPAEEQPTLLRTTCRDISRAKNFVDLAQRFTTDANFGNIVTRVIADRIVKLRGDTKVIATAKVDGAYNLISGDPATAVEVQGLLKDMRYIFPQKPGGHLVQRTKPYQHFGIKSTLQRWFVNSKKSIADKHQVIFKSSLVDDETAPEELRKEPELPLAMLALTATAVHSALDDWSSGVHVPRKFNADQYEEVYKLHVAFLMQIKTNKPRAYHRLMADLLKGVRVSSHSPVTVSTNGAMALLDMNGMDE